MNVYFNFYSRGSKFSKKVWGFLFPASILSATVIGAGMFALPFVFQSIGYVVGLIYLVLFVTVFSLVHLMYADIILRSGGDSQLANLAKRYIGGWSFLPSFLVATVGLILVLTVYLVLAGSFMRWLWPIGTLNAVIVFWLVGTLAIFFEIKKLAWLELIITVAMVIIVAILFASGLPRVTNFLSVAAFRSVGFWEGMSLLILPFGPILFSLSGRTAIPSILEYFKRQKVSSNLLPRVIVFGTAAPALIYLFFIFGVTGLSAVVSGDAISGLLTPSYALLLGVGLLGLAAIFSTYIIIGRSVRDSFIYDTKFSRVGAAILVTFLPMGLYLIGLQDFFTLVGVVGGIFLTLETLLIVSIWQRLNNKKVARKLLLHFGSGTVTILVSILSLGFIYEIFSLFF